MTECRPFQVKCNSQSIGMTCIYQTLQNSNKTPYCVGRSTVRCIKRADSVKCTVYNTVRIENKDFFHANKFLSEK